MVITIINCRIKRLLAIHTVTFEGAVYFLGL